MRFHDPVEVHAAADGIDLATIFSPKAGEVESSR
jgi:hypothetical protein